jgi:hypothetical protein
MKKLTFFYYLAAVALLGFSVSCEKDDDTETVKTFEVTVQLTYPAGFEPAASVTVSLENTITGAVVVNTTDAAGAASFTVVAGLYEASATDERADELYRYLINGRNNNIAVTDTWVNGTSASITLTATAVPKPAAGNVSPYGKLIIKELYVGGAQKDDASGAWLYDTYVTIYNNSTQPASIENLTLAHAFPLNSNSNSNFRVDGELIYASENWLPSAFGAWQYQQRDTLYPGEQMVISFGAAVNHTLTYSQAVNLANAAYYVCYDIDVFNHALTFPAPSELIPTSHYLKAYKYAGYGGNGWAMSNNSPAFFIFTPSDEMSFNDFVAAPENRTTHGASPSMPALKVPRTWVLDGIDVYRTGYESTNAKRLTPDIDAGYIYFDSGYGHTLYRNVDKAATEAIIANQGKLVYDYSLGFEESTDPSGIDAEASIKNGAHIIYKDTNNSTNDFHQRSRASLRVND